LQIENLVALRLLLVVMAVAPSAQLLADSPLDTFRNNETQIRQQRDRDRQELEQLKQTNEVAVPPLLGNDAIPLDDSARCFDVKQLQLQGVTLLATKQVDELRALVEERCVGMAQLSALLKRITNIYINKGYVTTRAYIPEQNLASGRLEILVVEGELEAIEAGESAGVNLPTAFPGLTRELLNLRQIEQGLAQINRLQSNNASMTLEPGEEPGLTRIVIHNTPSSRWSGDMSWDNTDGISADKINVGIGYDNALGLNDHFSLRLRKDTAFDRSSEYSENFSLNGVVPYGRWTYSLSYSYLRYSSHFSLQSSEIESSGTSASWSLNADRLLYRNPTGSLSLAMSLSHRDTRNYLNETFLDVSSRKLSVAKLGVNGYWRFGRLRLSSAVNINQGLKIFDALEDSSDLNHDAPQAQFQSYDGRVSVDTPLTLGSLRSNLSTTLSGQYSSDTLFGSEHFTVAGYSAVRGYEGSAAAGRGAHSRSDWSVMLPYSGIDGLDRNFSRYLNGATLRSFVAYDYGETFDRFGNDDRRFSSWSVGLSVQWQQLSLDLLYSDLIHSGANDDPNTPVAYASLRCRF